MVLHRLACKLHKMALTRLAVSLGRRSFSTSLARTAGYGEGVGSNVPFQIKNKWRMLAVMTIFFGSGFGAPFVLVRHQLKKK
ncbi:Cytochrome c oxidase subunit 7C, mitochondrial [Holothuria leucospilota]|uniref:Cytochrome c oxidase subunit 7C, mitochondrial n=1 Tax=Holothuria leucospilota TaxID=206669 RepID=A0A9Q1H7Z5_HOLLE|nr:Cytochrome c oxidase subunit 7C, mitochondrial [Holothuria leucospilota]